jgi:hypothetical protein
MTIAPSILTMTAFGEIFSPDVCQRRNFLGGICG